MDGDMHTYLMKEQNESRNAYFDVLRGAGILVGGLGAILIERPSSDSGILLQATCMPGIYSSIRRSSFSVRSLLPAARCSRD